MRRTRTVCPFCGCGCSFYLLSEGDRVIGIEPSPTNPVNKGMLCVKGWNAHEFIHSPERLTKPLVRKQGSLVESTWEEALKIVAEKLLDIKKQFGPRALAFLSSAKVTNEENYLFMKMARAAFGTNNVDHCARL
jgi:predicted molibdopterin-dependent oxidoreductase YjgC